MEFVCVELLSEQPLTQDVAADVVSIDGSAVSGSKLINPRRACAARVTVVGSVCLSVCLCVR